jgi:16S rRNA pseudouridine516 synthase
MSQRIDKILSHEGFGSRKDIKKLLRQAEVLVNGKQVFDPGTQVFPEKDKITVDGEELNIHTNLYLMMNKPKHYVCANKDGEHETVFDLLDPSIKTPYIMDRLHLIGRLDMDTEGLLIFTTDGELTHRVISPKSNCAKTYFVRLEKPLTEETKKQYEVKLKEGFLVPEEDHEAEFICLPSTIKFTENADEVLLTITEGKYHQVKRMFRALGNKVIYLKRISMNKLSLDETLALGEYRELTEEEIGML